MAPSNRSTACGRRDTPMTWAPVAATKTASAPSAPTGVASPKTPAVDARMMTVPWGHATVGPAGPTARATRPAPIGPLGAVAERRRRRQRRWFSPRPRCRRGSIRSGRRPRRRRRPRVRRRHRPERAAGPAPRPRQRAVRRRSRRLRRQGGPRRRARRRTRRTRRPAWPRPRWRQARSAGRRSRRPAGRPRRRCPSPRSVRMAVPDDATTTDPLPPAGRSRSRTGAPQVPSGPRSVP